MKDIDVTMICDVYEDRLMEGEKWVFEAKGVKPVCTTNYKDIINNSEIDAVIISSSWIGHIEISIEAMKAGKYVGCEVGGAFSIQSCWDLVKTYEETKVPCMLLENCNYGRPELLALKLAKMDMFGDIVHCEGSYTHDLRESVVMGLENRHYRLNNYLHRNADNYPTHDLGPIAKILNINRGNRMISLTSMASKSSGIDSYIKEHKGSDYYLNDVVFEQGDIVTTSIKCAHGETITLTLDTSLPTPYSRRFKVMGTKGRYNEENHSLFFEDEHMDFHSNWKEHWNNTDKYYEKYDHPIWEEYKDNLIGGHGGADYLVLRAFFESVKKQTNTPIDIYDMASWMCITTLTEDSIAMGSAPVPIPDFTNGKWINREPIVEGKYCLDKICVDEKTRIVCE